MRTTNLLSSVIWKRGGIVFFRRIQMRLVSSHAGRPRGQAEARLEEGKMLIFATRYV